MSYSCQTQTSLVGAGEQRRRHVERDSQDGRYGIFGRDRADHSALMPAAQIAEPSLYLGVGEAGIGLLVELLDNLGGRVLGRAEAIHEARLVARDELAHGRNVRQRLRP